MKRPKVKHNRVVLLIFVLLLIPNTPKAQYFTLVTSLEDNKQYGSCTFSLSNQIATTYVSDKAEIESDNLYFQVLSNDLQSSDVPQVSISTFGSPTTAVVDRYSGGYFIGAVFNNVFKAFALGEQGQVEKESILDYNMESNQIPTVLAADDEDSYFVCYHENDADRLKFQLNSDTDGTKVYSVLEEGNPLPDSISPTRDPTDSNSFFVLVSEFIGAVFNNKLYHLTLTGEDWVTMIKPAIENETDQSITVLKSGDLAFVFVSDNAKINLMIREPEFEGTILVNKVLLNIGTTKPFIKALPDGGFVVIYLNGSHVYYQLFDSLGSEFGPAIVATESGDPKPGSWNLCSSDDLFEFAVIYSIVDTDMSYKVAKHPIASPTPLTYTATCSPKAIVFYHGGDNIDEIYVKKFSGESYAVITPTMTGAGSDEITLIEENFDYEEKVEYAVFDEINRQYTSVTIDHSTLKLIKNLGDNSCDCTGESLTDEVANVCAELDDLEDPSLVATNGDDEAIELVLTLDSTEETNFFSEVTWTVSSPVDVTDLEAFLATQTGLEVTIPAENLVYSAEYTFIATTDYDRGDETTINYIDDPDASGGGGNNEEEGGEEEEDSTDDGFVVYNTATNYQFSYKLLTSNGQQATTNSQAASIQFKFIFPAANDYAQSCFEYGEVEDNIQNYECYGVRKVSSEFELTSLLCPRNVETGSGVCSSTSVTLALVSVSTVSSIDLGCRRVLQSDEFNKIVLSREISDSSSQIPSFPVGTPVSAFSFTNADYELDLDQIDDKTDPEGVLITIDQEDDDDNSTVSSYDFTDSAAPISMLIIGILFIVLTGLAIGLSKSLANYSAVNNLNVKAGWIKTNSIMLVTNHPLFGVYLFKSPTISKFQASLLYCSRAFAVLLFANVYNMIEFDTPRFLSSTENSEFTAGFLLLPYVTFLPVVFVLGVLLRATKTPKDEPNQVVKIITLLVICILIVLAFVFTILIQKNMTDDQRTKANKSFGQAMFQDLIVTPILTLILYSILQHFFFKKGAGESKSSKIGYLLVAESFQECMKKKQVIPQKKEEPATKYKVEDDDIPSVPSDPKIQKSVKNDESDTPNGNCNVQ